MKKLLAVLALLVGIYAFGQATTSEKDSDILINKLKFIGVTDVVLRPIYSNNGPLAGHLLMQVTLEYDVPKDKFLTISEMEANAIVIDKTLTTEDLLTYAYSDFCDIKQPGCVLKEYYKKFECGKYINDKKEDGPRVSIKFDGGRNTMVMTFDFGSLINIPLSNAATGRMATEGYVYPDNFIVNMVDMNRLFRLSNNLNGPEKNMSKLVIVAKGYANYNDAKTGTVRLGEVNLAVVLRRKKVDYLYENPLYFAKGN